MSINRISRIIIKTIWYSKSNISWIAEIKEDDADMLL